MFTVTSAICDNLRAKGKFKKEKYCILCATAMSKCKKLKDDKQYDPDSPDHERDIVEAKF